MSDNAMFTRRTAGAGGSKKVSVVECLPVTAVAREIGCVCTMLTVASLVASHRCLSFIHRPQSDSNTPDTTAFFAPPSTYAQTQQVGHCVNERREGEVNA